MKLTFIGTSHGVPEPNRKCSSILLEAGGNAYFIDMGTPPVDALRRLGIGVETVKAVFITHMHNDHTDGLIPFIGLMNWFFKKADPLICLPNIEAVPAIQSWIRLTESLPPRDIRYAQTQAGLVYDDGILQVTAIPTMHCANSFAYLVRGEGKTVLFTGDLKNPKIDFPSLEDVEQLDLLVCECAHFEAQDYLTAWKPEKLRKVCVTHFTDRRLPGILSLCKTLKEQGIEALRATDDLQLHI